MADIHATPEWAKGNARRHAVGSAHSIDAVFSSTQYFLSYIPNPIQS